MRCRRAIRTPLVFVLLGAVATVLTSWAIHAGQFWLMHQGWRLAYGWTHGSAAEFPRTQADRIATLDAWEPHRVLPHEPGWDSPNRIEFELPLRRRAWAWNLVTHRLSSDDLDPLGWHETREQLTLIDCGWPAPAMRCGSYAGTFFSHGYPLHRTHTPRRSIHGGFELMTRGPSASSRVAYNVGSHKILDRFALPLLPLWPGFLLNTFFYALLLFGAWRLPGMLRRAVRRRRGRCAGCGYSRDGLDAGTACPECGAGVAIGNGQLAIGKRGRPARRA